MAGDEVKFFNTAKKEAEEIVFPIIQGHRHHMRQSRTGELKDVPVEKISQNQRNLNRVKALHLIISSQKDMIQVARPIVRYKSLRDWEKKEKEEREKTPFEKDENDYNRLIDIRKFLDFLDSEIVRISKAGNKEEDFLREINANGLNEIKNELTKNFFDMLNELEDTYEEAYTILIKHKIVSAGISEDEEMTYKEQEKAFIERVKEA